MHSKRDLMRFIKLPWRLYRNEPRWVPPLIRERKRHLDREHNPFFEHAEAEYFLARRDGRVVGRITAQVDRRFNEFQRQRLGPVRLLRVRERPGDRPGAARRRPTPGCASGAATT